MTDETNSQEIPAEPLEKKSGCGMLMLFILSAVWIIVISLITQGGEWIVEQAVFEGSLSIPDLRWGILLGFNFAITIPIVIVYALIKNTTYKAVYQTFLLAVIFNFLLIPVHFSGVTSAQITALLQILGSVLFLAGVFFWLVKKKKMGLDFFRKSSSNEIMISVLAAVVMGYTWLAWGAVGSILDTLLNLAAGFLYGASVMMILKLGIFEKSLQNDGIFHAKDFWFYGFITFLVILLTVTGFGHNGNQWLLLISIPWLGWPVAAYLGRTGERQSIWPGLIMIGLSAAWPLILMDPDELSVVVNSGNGELISWALKAAFGSAFIGLIILVVSLINPKKLERVGFGLAVIAIFIAAGIYLIIGKPGFYGEKIFVIMKSQTDLSKIAAVEPAEKRRDLVYRSMVEESNKSQADLRSALQKFGISYEPYYLVNGLEVNGGPLIRWWLQSRPDVDRVLDSPYLRPLPGALTIGKGELTQAGGTQWNLEMIHADRVWSELGVTGKGIIVGQSDSGVFGTHVELSDSYRGRDGKNDYNWFDPWFGSKEPVDKNGHGTHTLGSILGDHVGVAPDADWIGCVNLGRNLGNPAFYLDCMQFMLAPFPQNGDPFIDGKPELGANVLNNSWGCPVVEGCDPDTFLVGVEALRTAGVFVVVSAGNSGMKGCGSVSDPLAIYEDVLSVGAVNSAGQRAMFSSMGPVTVDSSNRTKPDVMAPGEDVFSSFPENTYSISSGTSMAGPHVVGVVALMWSANPKLIGKIDQTIEIIEKTANPMSDPSISCGDQTSSQNNVTGYGIVNAFEAVKMALEVE